MKNDFKLRNKKSAAIIRVSSMRQKDNNSHQLQEEKIRQYAKDLGLELIGVYKIVESAKRAEDRKKYNKAIEECLRNDVYNILYYMTDREARNLTDNEKNEYLVKADRIAIHYVSNGKILHKESSSSDFLVRDMEAITNKNFVRVLSEKVIDAMIQKAESGWYPGNHPPLGYAHQRLRDDSGREKKRGTIIVPNPDLRMVKLVQREYALRATGFTLDQIHDKNREEGFVSLSMQHKYSRRGIEDRLKSKFYSGTFLWDSKEYKGKHELIIDPTTLRKVKESFGIKAKYNRTTHLQSVFSGGFIRCADSACGLQLVYEPKTKTNKRTNTKKTYHYYRCTNTRGIHKNLTYMTEEKLWEQLASAVQQIHISEMLANQISEALNLANENVKGAIRKDIQNYQIELDKLDERKNSFFDLFVDKAISADDFREQTHRLQEQRRSLTKLLEEKQTAISDAWTITAQKVLELAMNAKSLWNSGSVDQKLELLQKLTSNRFLDGITIRYNYRKPFAVLAEIAKKDDWRSQGDSNPCILREREVS